MRTFVLLGAAVLSCGCTIAATAQQAEMPLLEHFREKSEMLPGHPYLVLRMDLDVTGDDVSDLLLAKTLPDGRSGEQEWLVYVPAGAGKYRLLGILDFSFQLFRLDEQRRLVVYDKGLAVLVTYRVDGTGFHEESRQMGVVPGGPEWEAFKSWREAVKLRVLSADLKDIEMNTSPKWTDLLKNEVVPGVGNFGGLVVVE